MSLSKDANWWRQAAIYQIYPRSFKDSNGDGIGDLKGITSQVPYLKSLSLDAVWLSPFYPSALADGGYDVDDYRNVDPKLGTLEDFDEMLQALHEAGIRVFVDIVPNHSSNLHQWFIDALNSEPGSPERARYIFRDSGIAIFSRQSNLISTGITRRWKQISLRPFVSGQIVALMASV